LKAARAQLESVVERSDSAELKDLSRLRLANVLLDEKSYDEALKLLDAAHGSAFDAQYAVIRGDILLAKNQRDEAKSAYRLALEKSDPKSGAFRESVTMRLDALGG
jgi:predicted negative regulator of RcsB-dependent stress response